MTDTHSTPFESSPQGEPQTNPQEFYANYLTGHFTPRCSCDIQDGFRLWCPHAWWGCPEQWAAIDYGIPTADAPRTDAGREGAE